MNNAQIWVPEGLGGGERKVCEAVGGAPAAQTSHRLCLIFRLNVAHFSSTVLVSEPRAGF